MSPCVDGEHIDPSCHHFASEVLPPRSVRGCEANIVLVLVLDPTSTARTLAQCATQPHPRRRSSSRCGCPGSLHYSYDPRTVACLLICLGGWD